MNWLPGVQKTIFQYFQVLFFQLIIKMIIIKIIETNNENVKDICFSNAQRNHGIVTTYYMHDINYFLIKNIN